MWRCTFPWNQLNVTCVRGYESMRLISIVSHPEKKCVNHSVFHFVFRAVCCSCSLLRWRWRLDTTKNRSQFFTGDLGLWLEEHDMRNHLNLALIRCCYLFQCFGNCRDQNFKLKGLLDKTCMRNNAQCAVHIGVRRGSAEDERQILSMRAGLQTAQYLYSRDVREIEIKDENFNRQRFQRRMLAPHAAK